MSRIGLALSLAYLAIAVACISFALSSGDPKGQFVLLQLPIALQGALLEAIGWGAVLHGLSWPIAYALLALPTVVLLYLLGQLVSNAISSNQSFQRTASGGR